MINKARLDHAIKSYIDTLESKGLDEIKLWDDCLYNYQESWDMDQLDFRSNFKQSFKSTISTRLWKGDNFYPIDVMMDFIEYEKEIIRSLFRDLYDETKSVDGRMQRFVFYCDQLINEIRDRGKIYPTHYHENYYMPSLYLSMEYPDKYWFYDIEIFGKAIIQLGDQRPLPAHDIERYYKILNLLNNLLVKEDSFIQWRDKVYGILKYQKHSKMWAFDLMKFISDN